MDYEELEYIESTQRGNSGQCIDTGILATEVDGFETRVEQIEEGYSWRSIMGNTTDDFTIGHAQFDKRIYIRIFYNEYARTEAQCISLHDRTLTFGDESVVVESNVTSLGKKATPIWLFNTTESGRHGEARIYYLRLYKSDTLVADLHPVVRKTDNAVGMWDTVRRQFFENIGIGAFVAGEPTGRYF